jgi:ATP-dependent DNA ligase
MFDSEFVSSGDMILRDLPGKFWDKLMEPRHPHLVWLKNKFGGQLPIYPHVGKTVSIMGSLGAEAVRKQQEIGLIWAYTFDITRFMGKDLTQNPQIARRRFLASQLEAVDPESGIILMPAWMNLTTAEREEFFYLITEPFYDIGEDGGEGLIIKDPTQKYNGPKNWYKVKANWPGDVVYTGVSKEGEEGKTGQMLGMAASLEIGVYHNDALLPIGWVSGIRDGMAGLQTPQQHMQQNAGKAIEVRHNGLQEKPDAPLGYTLRHPRFRRDRDDKNPTDCTWSNLYAEASKKRD